VQHFDGNVPPEPLVVRAPDDAHPAAAELFDGAVTAGEGAHRGDDRASRDRSVRRANARRLAEPPHGRRSGAGWI
jgi:hypothetical protein